MKKFIIALAAVAAISTAAYAENSDESQFGANNSAPVYQTPAAHAKHLRKLKVYQNTEINSSSDRSLNGDVQSQPEFETSRGNQ